MAVVFTEPPSDPGMSRVDRAYFAIRHRITYATYAPGTHLSETILARVLHMSRTPIREALLRLSQEHYVTWEPGRGFLVAPVTVEMIRHIFEVRRVLEGAAAAAAAERATPREIEAMRERARHNTNVGDHDSYLQLLTTSMDFHLTVSGASHNPLFVDLTRRHLFQTCRLMSLALHCQLFHGNTSEDHSTEEHIAIVDAIRFHDATAARAIMEEHVMNTLGRIVKTATEGEYRGIAP